MRDRMEEHFPAAIRSFIGRRVPTQDADDVAQDVLLRIYEGTQSLRNTSKLEAWAYGIARRTIADYYRSRRLPDSSGDEVEAIPDSDSDAGSGFATFQGDHSVHEEVLGWLRPAAEQLPAKYRDALLLADFEGRTQKEMAEILGLSLAGAKSRVRRARVLLGQELARCCEIALSREGKAIDFHRRNCKDC